MISSQWSSKRRVFPLVVDTNEPWSALDSRSSTSGSGSGSGSGSPTAAISGGFARGGSRAPPPPKSPLHGAKRSTAASSSSNGEFAPTRGVDRMLQLRQGMNVTSSAGYQTAQTHDEPTRPGQLPPIAHQSSVATVMQTPQTAELSAAQIHKERKLAESRRRQEVLLMTQEDYTDKPEGFERLARQQERVQMQEEELRMARIVQAEKALARAQLLQQQREEEACIREMYLTKLRLDREEKERVAKEKEVARTQALELKMRALKDAADAKAREEYAARQRQIEDEALVEREQRISEIEVARLAVEDELAGAMRQEFVAEMERKQQIAAEEAQWKQFEAAEAQKQLEATLKRRAAQAEQYEQDKQRRMEIHRLQKERARLAERKQKQAAAIQDDPAIEAQHAERSSPQIALLDNAISNLHGEDGSAGMVVSTTASEEDVVSAEQERQDDDAGSTSSAEDEDAAESKRRGGDCEPSSILSVAASRDDSAGHPDSIEEIQSDDVAQNGDPETRERVVRVSTQDEAPDSVASVLLSGQPSPPDSSELARDVQAEERQRGDPAEVCESTDRNTSTEGKGEGGVNEDAVEVSHELGAATTSRDAEDSGSRAASGAEVKAVGCDDAPLLANGDGRRSCAADSAEAELDVSSKPEEQQGATQTTSDVDVRLSDQDERINPTDSATTGFRAPGTAEGKPESESPPQEVRHAYAVSEDEVTPADPDAAPHAAENNELSSPATDSAEDPSTALGIQEDYAATTQPGIEHQGFSGQTSQLWSTSDARAQGWNPFAQVLHVKDGSPAMEATLQAGDLLIDFGGLRSNTPNCLLLIAEQVKRSVGHEVELVVLRPEGSTLTTGDDEAKFTRESFSLRPRKWKGKGLLGCQLNPFKWTEEQDPEPERVTGDTAEHETAAAAVAASATEQAVDGGSTSLLVFYNVAADSVADQAGIKNGDLLMKCGELEAANDLRAVAEYFLAAKADQIPIELELQRWIPEDQQYQQVVLALSNTAASEPLGCSMTTFAEYYSTSDASAVDSATAAAAATLSPCMDCYYTTLATSVHAAALNGHVACLEALYEASCQEESGGTEDQSSRNSSSSSVLDWRDSDGRSPLFYACYGQQVESVKFLLAHTTHDEIFDPQTGADMYGDSPLHAATLSGSVEILTMLLESKYIAVDIVNATQLACAHLAPSFDVLEVLGERFGADLLVADADGRMPLSHACLRNDLESVAYLCEKHPDFVDYADSSGNTPLHLSAWLGYLDVIKILITYVPSIALYMPNQDGSNPLEIAQTSGCDEAAQFLEECMAARNQDDEDYGA